MSWEAMVFCHGPNNVLGKKGSVTKATKFPLLYYTLGCIMVYYILILNILTLCLKFFKTFREKTELYVNHRLYRPKKRSSNRPSVFLRPIKIDRFGLN